MLIYDEITRLPIFNEKFYAVFVGINSLENNKEFYVVYEKESDENAEYDFPEASHDGSYYFFRKETFDVLTDSVCMFSKEKLTSDSFKNPRVVCDTLRYFINSYNTDHIPTDKILFYHAMCNVLHKNHLNLVKEHVKKMKQNKTYDKFLEKWGRK